MATQTYRPKRAPGFVPLLLVFLLFIAFLYGPMLTIFILSFQGPEGGLTFPLQGVSLHWFRKLAEGLGVVDIGAALKRSLTLGVIVMLLTVLLSVLAGLAFRKRLKGGNALFYVTVASLIMPSIIVSLGIGLQFRLLDGVIKKGLEFLGATNMLEGFGTSLGLYTSALGAHLTWTLPFGLLIMFAVFNRFNPAYEERLGGHAVANFQIRRPALDCALHRRHRYVWLHVELGRNCPHFAGDWRCQHLATGAARFDFYRNDAIDLCVSDGHNLDFLCGHRSCLCR
jgi:ABC-type spermidine/putrescine transport system permease subunit II